jgi:hypothetical protein
MLASNDPCRGACIRDRAQNSHARLGRAVRSGAVLAMD